MTLLCPLMCVVYAACRYGCGNVCVWFSYHGTHSNPIFPIFYSPEEVRHPPC